MAKIHPTAVVDPHAELASDVEIGPYVVIGTNVKIADGTKIRSHAVIDGITTIGRGNVIFPFATVGTIPQDLKYRDEPSELVIGDNNTIREFASLNPGTVGGGMITRVGSQNLLMMYCHIAHDCIVGNRNVIANGATLGGHVVIEDNVIVGGLVGIHQFVRIGTGAILGAGSMVSKDVPPFCNATGDRAKLHGLNVEGMKRRGFDQAKIDAIHKAYRIVFRSKLKISEALEKIRQELPALPELDQFA
ncbi:MAG TPA: acyl-ACP--UDP-N-acetylglucosamine O-acyltransferase, partial [Candidatus Binatia bacterium]|nr:acyl-ACP--UDP-N-acetylglucosamine O-acyltransferase [Candidatus Binatia bacterium]